PWRTSETRMAEIVRAMVGRRLEEAFPEPSPISLSAPVLLAARDLAGARVGPVSFEVRAGEILGFAGLEGSGVEDLFLLLFGLEPLTSGEVTYARGSRRARSPLEAIRQGLGLIPRSRREQGLIMDWSIRRNATLT